jgi:hypothetical protein
MLLNDLLSCIQIQSFIVSRGVGVAVAVKLLYIFTIILELYVDSYKNILVFFTSSGFIVKLKIFDSPTPQQLFDDQDFWEVTPLFV